jgi:hypothetical protein
MTVHTANMSDIGPAPAPHTPQRVPSPRRPCCTPISAASSPACAGDQHRFRVEPAGA